MNTIVQAEAIELAWLVLRAFAGLAILLFLPGYSLLAALYPDPLDLDKLDRLGIGIGLSIAISTGIVLGLNASPWGIQSVTIISSIGIFSFVSLVVYWFRKRPFLAKRKSAHKDHDALKSSWASRKRVFAFLLSMGLIISLFGIGMILGTDTSLAEELTQFYVLDAFGNVTEYPLIVSPNQPVTVTLGVSNHEGRDVDYLILRKLKGGPVEQLARFRLSTGRTWEGLSTFSLNGTGATQKVIFTLHRDMTSEPYRSLHLWINVIQEPQEDRLPSPS